MQLSDRELDIFDYIAISVWFLAVLITLIFVTGCASTYVAPSNTNFYRRDVDIKVDNVEYPGYGVLPIKDSYTITVTTKHDVDVFTASDCHKSIVQEKVASENWFATTATFTFQFQRSNPVEQEDPCPLEITASAKSNEHSFGFLDFQTTAETLPATLECDGWKQTYYGVSVCQAKKGLVQAIHFTEPVVTSFDPACQIPIPKDNMNFIFEIPRGRCTFMFATKTAKWHRMDTLGYDDVWMRSQ